MFTSVIFDDINKAAFDVMKDGFSFDQKATLKSSCHGCNMTLEGNNFTSAFGGKFSVDFKPLKFLSVKKLSIDNTGSTICDIDIPEVVSGVTLMIRSQSDACSYDMKKATCGLKYVSDRFTCETTYDIMSKKIASSAKCNMMVGFKLQGTTESVSSYDVAAAYRFSECVFSATTRNNLTMVDAAIYAKPYKNIQFGANCLVSLTETKTPAIGFGVCVKPTSSSEMRTKIASDGKVYGFYKTSMTKNIILSLSGAVDYNNFMNGSHKVGIAVEMKI